MDKMVFIFSFFNIILILANGGFYYYTNLVYKRPTITEQNEIKRITTTPTTQKKPIESGLISFNPLTVNIQSIPEKTGKAHYATLTFSVEVQDKNQDTILTTLRPILLDHLIQLLGKKSFHELTTVQGRSILELEMVDFLNQWISTHFTPPRREPLISRIYWTQFIVQ